MDKCYITPNSVAVYAKVRLPPMMRDAMPSHARSAMVNPLLQPFFATRHIPVMHPAIIPKKMSPFQFPVNRRLARSIVPKKSKSSHVKSKNGPELDGHVISSFAFCGSHFTLVSTPFRV